MLPQLEDYGVSPASGFLPSEPPLQELPAPYNTWENVARDIPALIHTYQLRVLVDRMPILSAAKLHIVQEQRRAYSVLGFLAHAYVWSPPTVTNRLPRQIAEPLLTLSESLGLPPLATYSGLCLWNFRTVVPCKSPADWNLETVATTLLFTGGYDEAWFYTVSIALERLGGPCLENGLEAIRAAHNKSGKEVILSLDKLASDIKELTTVLGRMGEFLDPHFFYHRLRPYLAGWKNMVNAGLADGLFYGNETEPRQYSGGSNGQSSLIQALDVILNVEHHALGERTPASVMGNKIPSKDDKSPGAFLIEMRKYMPREHRRFLEDLEKVACVRDYVMLNANKQPQLVKSYDNCLQVLRDFRSKHIQVVMRFISMQARESSSGSGMGLAISNGETGTGGTELMPFLKQTRDEVSDAAVGHWGRAIVSNTYSGI